MVQKMPLFSGKNLSFVRGGPRPAEMNGSCRSGSGLDVAGLRKAGSLTVVRCDVPVDALDFQAADQEPEAYSSLPSPKSPFGLGIYRRTCGDTSSHTKRQLRHQTCACPIGGADWSGGRLKINLQVLVLLPVTCCDSAEWQKMSEVDAIEAGLQQLEMC